MDPSLSRLKNDFIEEANGLLDQLEKDLLALESNPSDKSLIESVFRAMHTLKGAGSMFGFSHISDFTHRLESLYQLIREKRKELTRSISELTFQAIDHIRQMLSDDQLMDQANRENHEKLLTSLQEISNEQPSNRLKDISKESDPDNGFHTWHIVLYATESILMRGVKLFTIIKQLAEIGEYRINRIENHEENKEEIDDWSILLFTDATEDQIRDVLLFIEDDCTLVKISNENLISGKTLGHVSNEKDISILDYIEEKNNLPASDRQGPHLTDIVKPDKQALKRISVDASKLDQLMFLVSELITVNAQLSLSTHDILYNPIKPYLEKIDSLSRQFRNNALEIRLVPLSDTVLRFQRLIRDLSNMLNKQINFITKGTNTELDKNTIDKLAEPLMHIIRNCIDHGIESPELRMKSGKPETGSITMEAYNSGNNVIISISDDGCGIDDEKVRQKAEDMGFIKAGEKPDKKQLYDFIFMPGFSTAQTLTEVSGRGVGMDVVKQRITELRGEIAVDSTRNVGTSFTLKLQQSMSIVDSLLFRVDKSFFTVPITEIAVCDQVESPDICNQGHTGTLPFNNHLIPFVDLRVLFSTGGNRPDRLKTIIINSNGKQIALLCDRIIGEHQAVMKPLGKSFRDQRYITAASQMGDGQMAFMLDTNALFKLKAV